MFGIFTLNARINQSLTERLCPIAKQKKLEREKAELQKNLKKMEKRDGRKRTRVRRLVASKLRSRQSTSTAAQASSSRSSSPGSKTSSQAIKTAKKIGSTIIDQVLLIPSLQVKYASFCIVNICVKTAGLDPVTQEVVDYVVYFSRLMGTTIDGSREIVEQGGIRQRVVEAVEDLRERILRRKEKEVEEEEEEWFDTQSQWSLSL